MRSSCLRNRLALSTISKTFVGSFALLNYRKFASNVGHSRSVLAMKKGGGRSVSTISSPEENMAHVQASIELRADEILTGLEQKGWVTIDNFLGEDVCCKYRSEAVGYFTRNEMSISKSTRWDSDTHSVVSYDKHNVFATQLNGGESYYDGPRLHEYVVSLVKTMVPIVSKRFPEACLHPTLASNKLAVCTGDGSYYDKHYDNSGGDDLRKLTVLYYLNPNWRKDMGGCFRIYGSEESSDHNTEVATLDDIAAGSDITTIDVDPIGDRLLVFWSDRLVHSVQPSQVRPTTFHPKMILFILIAKDLSACAKPAFDVY
jgi:2OG-Fe(II) oxygenase superfamily